MLVGICGATLGACTDPQRVAATAPSVTYRYTGDALNEVALKASQDCAAYGKRAQLRSVIRQPADNLAIYDCM